MKKTLNNFGSLKQTGFTLVEFIVASAIGMIITIAVGSLYFYTSRLNTIAKMNLEIHEDLRQAAQQISQDASLAGSFGCLTLGSLYQSDSINTDNKFSREFHVFYNSNIDKNSPIVFDKPGSSATSNNQNFGVNIIDSSSLNVPNFTGNGKALIFYYGSGSSGITNLSAGSNGDIIDSFTYQDGDPQKSLLAVANQGGYLALSSCKALYVFKANKNANELTFNENVRVAIDDETNKQKITEMTLLKYNVHAYAVGTSNGQLGFYKIELNEDGSWGPAALISDHITNMSTAFLYPSALNQDHQPIGCPSALNDDIFPNELASDRLLELNKKFNDYSFYHLTNATFNETSNPSNPKTAVNEDLNQPLEDEYYLSPVAVEVNLTITYPNISQPFGMGDENLKQNNADSATATTKNYRILSSIRGGNQCANRNLLD